MVLDYIKASLDILLNGHKKAFSEDEEVMYINSSRGGHGDIWSESSISSMTNRDEPPKVYEELIQSLEAEVRKHIRIEQQLKLHIESIEYRLDELESEN